MFALTYVLIKQLTFMGNQAPSCSFRFIPMPVYNWHEIYKIAWASMQLITLFWTWTFSQLRNQDSRVNVWQGEMLI